MEPKTFTIPKPEPDLYAYRIEQQDKALLITILAKSAEIAYSYRAKQIAHEAGSQHLGQTNASIETFGPALPFDINDPDNDVPNEKLRVKTGAEEALYAKGIRYKRVFRVKGDWR